MWEQSAQPTAWQPRERGACSSYADGTETAEVKVPWSGRHLVGRSSAEDGRGQGLENPEALVAEIDEALVSGTSEDGRGVAEAEIPKRR